MIKTDYRNSNLKYTIASEAIGTTWSFNDFVKNHGDYGAVVVTDSNRGLLEYGIFEDANNNKIVTCVSNVVKEYSEKEFENNKHNLEVIVLESGLYCVCERWEDVCLSEPQNSSWSLLEFAKTHGKMQVGEFKDKNTGEIFKACIFTKPNDGTRTFVAFSSAMGELTPKQIAAMKDELYVVQLKSGNYSLCKIKKNQWEDVILNDDDNNSSCEQEDNTTSKEEKKNIRGAEIDTLSQKLIDVPQEKIKEESEINWRNLTEIKRKVVEPYAPISTPTDFQGRSTSTNKNASFRRKKDTKPTPSHYQAVFVVMLITVVLGFSVYYSNMIRLEQDRMFFLVTCCILAIVDWGYPYYDASVKIDNDGCFAQGCMHPIIGIFSFFLFPVLIHYWLYKGVKVCIIKLKDFISQRIYNKKNGLMKKLLLLFGFCFVVSGLQAQNVHYVDVRVKEANNPNYVVESSYEPMSTDMMIASARYRVNKFNEYRDKAYSALSKGDKYGFITYTNYALSMDYYSAKMYYDRGIVFQDLGDYKQAKKNFKKAKKHGYYQANQALAELKELTKKK